MANRIRLEKFQTASTRFAAYSLLILLVFLMIGCQGVRLAASPAHAASAAACGEGMLAAQAWKCLASGTVRP